jgi:hypothetical protein
MKRLMTALLIVGIGSSIACALRRTVVRLRFESSSIAQSLATQTLLVNQARLQVTNLEERIHDLKEKSESKPPPGGPEDNDSLLALTGLSQLTPAQRERLLAALGFNWNTTGDYLIVSKDTLKSINPTALNGFRLRDVACKVLAITPEERSSIEGMTQRLSEDYKAWASAHGQRQEPSGDIVAQYTLPADADFNLALSNSFTTGIVTTLGNERGELLLHYAQSWLGELSTDSERSITLKRFVSGTEPHLGYELKTAYSTSTSEVSRQQPFPEAFAGLFPNGWRDLAQREGFELPKDFR